MPRTILDSSAPDPSTLLTWLPPAQLPLPPKGQRLICLLRATGSPRNAPGRPETLTRLQVDRLRRIGRVTVCGALVEWALAFPPAPPPPPPATARATARRSR